VNIRTTLIDGEPWFAAADVCRALGLAYSPRSGTSKFIAHLLGTERRVVRLIATDQTGGKSRGNPNVSVVSESGLYKLIMRSDKPEARAFQDWVTSEVLPSIRKTGSYALADHGREAMPLPMDIAEAIATALNKELAP
jgi:prophage antirepressor-like protein